jgi:hypothetical protein
MIWGRICCGFVDFGADSLQTESGRRARGSRGGSRSGILLLLL